MTDIVSTELGASGRYIDLGSPAALDDLTAITILVYARPQSGTAFPYFFGKTPTGSIDGLRFFINHNGGTPTFVLGGHSSTSPSLPQKSSPTGVVSYNSWQHFGATWSKTIYGSSITLYHGAGVDVTDAGGTGTDGTGVVDSDAAHPVFLMNRYGLGREFTGDYAYIAVWDRVLTLTELRNAQNNGPLSESSGLVLLWANEQDYSTNALTPSARSTFVAGSLPPNVALGGTDTTEPTLTSPTGTATGESTADGSVTTDEGNGTLYAVVTTSATKPSVAQIQAGQDHTGSAAPYSTSQAVTATGVQNISATGLSASTGYYWHYQHQDAATNDSTVATSAQFTTDAPDLTAPALTSPTGTQTGSTTANGSVTTDEGNGTLYAVVTTSATKPSVAQIQAGQDHTGAAAAYATSQAVNATGVQNVSATGLSPATGYYWHYQQQDAATNDSTVATSAQFTTASAAVKGASITLHDGTTPQASITNILALWWDAASPTGAPAFESSTASTDASGVMTLDLDNDTALAIGATGFLMLYKLDGTDHRDSLVFAGQVDVVDIS